MVGVVRADNRGSPTRDLLSADRRPLDGREGLEILADPARRFHARRDPEGVPHVCLDARGRRVSKDGRLAAELCEESVGEAASKQLPIRQVDPTRIQSMPLPVVMTEKSIPVVANPRCVTNHFALRTRPRTALATLLDFSGRIERSDP